MKIPPDIQRFPIVFEADPSTPRLIGAVTCKDHRAEFLHPITYEEWEQYKEHQTALREPLKDSIQALAGVARSNQHIIHSSRETLMDLREELIAIAEDLRERFRPLLSQVTIFEQHENEHEFPDLEAEGDNQNSLLADKSVLDDEEIDERRILHRTRKYIELLFDSRYLPEMETLEKTLIDDRIKIEELQEIICRAIGFTDDFSKNALAQLRAIDVRIGESYEELYAEVSDKERKKTVELLERLEKFEAYLNTHSSDFKEFDQAYQKLNNKSGTKFPLAAAWEPLIKGLPIMAEAAEELQNICKLEGIRLGDIRTFETHATTISLLCARTVENYDAIMSTMLGILDYKKIPLTSIEKALPKAEDETRPNSLEVQRIIHSFYQQQSLGLLDKDIEKLNTQLRQINEEIKSLVVSIPMWMNNLKKRSCLQVPERK